VLYLSWPQKLFGVRGWCTSPCPSNTSEWTVSSDISFRPLLPGNTEDIVSGLVLQKSSIIVYIHNRPHLFSMIFKVWSYHVCSYINFSSPKIHLWNTFKIYKLKLRLGCPCGIGQGSFERYMVYYKKLSGSRQWNESGEASAPLKLHWPSRPKDFPYRMERWCGRWTCTLYDRT